MKKKMKRPDMGRLGPSGGTTMEVLLRENIGSYSHSAFNVRALPGSPDAVVVDEHRRLAIFVDGRFWHDPVTARARQKPHHKTDFVEKAKANQARDRKVDAELRSLGFSIIRIWDDPENVGRHFPLIMRKVLNAVDHALDESAWKQVTVRAVVSRGKISIGRPKFCPFVVYGPWVLLRTVLRRSAAKDPVKSAAARLRGEKKR